MSASCSACSPAEAGRPKMLAHHGYASLSFTLQPCSHSKQGRPWCSQMWPETSPQICSHAFPRTDSNIFRSRSLSGQTNHLPALLFLALAARLEGGGDLKIRKGPWPRAIKKKRQPKGVMHFYEPNLGRKPRQGAYFLLDISWSGCCYIHTSGVFEKTTVLHLHHSSG